MRVLIAQPEFRVGRVEENYRLILNEMEQARANHCDVLLVAPLGIFNLTSYPELPHAQRMAFEAQRELLARLGDQSKGLHVFIMAREEGVPHPFDEAFIEYNGDSWTQHTIEPPQDFTMEDLIEHRRTGMAEWLETEHEGERFLIGLTHADFDLDTLEEQTELFVQEAQREGCVVFRLAQGGIEGNAVKLGHSGYYTPDGQHQELGVAPGRIIYDSQKPEEREELYVSLSQQTALPLLHDALVSGLRSFFAAQGLRKATFGLSGGIDSAVVAALAAEALGPQNVLAVLLPSQYTSPESIRDAEQLARNLGVEHTTIPITPVTEAFGQSLHPLFDGLAPDTTEENLQARTRAVILMAISNKLGYALLNTSNKSEIYVGYSTMYGDSCGAVSVLGDIFKTEVYALARYINRNEQIIPQYIIDRPPSAELREGQKDQDSLPPYEVLDNFLLQLLHYQFPLHEIRENGEFAPEDIDRMVALIQRSRYKRSQFPPILKVYTPLFPFTESLEGIWPAE